MHAVILNIIVSFIYGAVALDYWRLASQEEKRLKLHSMMLLLGIFLHAVVLYTNMFNDGINFGVFNAISTILWLTLVVYWVIDIRQTFHSLQAFVLPPATLFVLLPIFVSNTHYLPTAETSPQSLIFKLHIGIAMMAYSLFTFAALHTWMMTLAERSLHQKLNLVKLPSFPPLMQMEKLLFRVMSVGFGLLTLTLISGVFFSEALFGKPLQFNHKTIFSIASWLIYAGLLFGRWKYGWRGKKAIIWSQTGFLLLLLSYIGTKFVLEVILHR